MLKVNDSYIDFNEDVEMERQVKLFEQIADAVGDFSYSFTIDGGKVNRTALEMFSINQNDKLIYTKIPASLESDDAKQLYFGFIKVERDRETEIDCSFFSGNNNWFNDLDFNIRDFDFSEYDKDWSKTDIVATEAATSGTLFPVIDTGALADRSYVNWHIDDMHPFIYVKSVIQTLLNKSGITLQGDILQDWRYTRLITSNAAAAAPQEEIKDRSVFVNKSTTQSIPAGFPGAGTYYVVTFPNVTLNYYPGTLWDSGAHEFTADVDMLIDIKLTMNAEPLVNNVLQIYIKVNGNNIYDKNGYLIFPSFAFGPGPYTQSGAFRGVRLSAGDVLNINALFVSTTGTADIYSATLTITPTRLYKSFSNYLLPDVKAKDFVASVFSLFNTVINYNAVDKVLNVNLFKNLIRNEEEDISEYIDRSTIEDDYVELISDYGKVNVFQYADGDEEALKRYNDGSLYPFGSGIIESGNELTEPIVDVLDSIFVASMENNDNPFKTYLPRYGWRSISDGDLSEEAIVADNSGPSSTLNFIMPGLHIGDLVRIFNSTIEDYNGEWIVSAVTTVSGLTTEFRVAGLLYNGDATVDVQQLVIDFNDNDEQALLLALPDYPLSSFTNGTLMFYADSSSVSGASTPATAYFYKPIQGLNVDDYEESLSFGAPDIENGHQITMIDSYWKDFEIILRDPMKFRSLAQLPVTVFDNIYTGPKRITTSRGTSKYFFNRITGYKSSEKACEIQLIKL